MDFPADRPVAAEAPVTLGLPGLVWYGRGRWDALAVVSDAGPGARPSYPT